MGGGKRRGRERHVSWVNPLGVKRLVVGGREFWVKNIIHVDENQIVFEDFDGTVKAIPLKEERKEFKGAILT